MNTLAHPRSAEPPGGGHAVRPSSSSGAADGQAGGSSSGGAGANARRRHLAVPSFPAVPHSPSASASTPRSQPAGTHIAPLSSTTTPSHPSHPSLSPIPPPRPTRADTFAFQAAHYKFTMASPALAPPAHPHHPHPHSHPHSRAAHPAPSLAHKSAHYLHSIPPREKTTRTLILDHVLWKHGKARFAQARAELGLRIFQEDEEDDDADDADGADDVEALRYRPSAGKARATAVSLGPGDTAKARAYKLAADGHENVLSAMLEQPPEVQYGQFDESDAAGGVGITKAAPLPNGVRLRLTLTSLVNDFFARDDDPVILSRGAYPPSIVVLQLISNPCAPASSLPTLPSLADLLNSSPAPQASAQASGSGSQQPMAEGAKPASTSIWSVVPRGMGPDAPWAFAGTVQSPTASTHPTLPSPGGAGSGSYPPQPGPSDWPKLNSAPGSSPAARAIALYNAGALAPLNPIQCTRHLTPCNCLSGPAPTLAAHARGHIGAGLRRPSLRLLRRRSSLFRGLDGQSTSLPTSRLTDLLPRFIRLSALVAIELGREAAAAAAEESRSTSVRPSASLSASASVAGDTTDSGATSPYASDADQETEAGERERVPGPARPSRAWYALLCTLATRACLEGYLARGWRGTEGVETLFGLGVDLGMSLDGLVDGVDDGGNAGAGSGGGSGNGNGNGGDEPMTDADAEDGAEDAAGAELLLEPDDWPSMEDAARVLFPISAGAQGAEGDVLGGSGSGMQGEYEQEMRDRRDLFLNIPSNTSDLRSHLMELAARYPPEPMERAALKFCEAVSRWRGRPELQLNPQKNRLRSMSVASTTSQSALSISSLINPPQPPRPPIERWFVPPSRAERRRAGAGAPRGLGLGPGSSRATGGKRKREREPSVGGGAREGKGKGKGKKGGAAAAAVGPGQRAGRGNEGGREKGYIDEGDWVGPYGIPG